MVEREMQSTTRVLTTRVIPLFDSYKYAVEHPLCHCVRFRSNSDFFELFKLKDFRALVLPP